jgi:hypothetical protein
VGGEWNRIELRRTIVTEVVMSMMAKSKEDMRYLLLGIVSEAYCLYVFALGCGLTRSWP